MHRSGIFSSFYFFHFSSEDQLIYFIHFKVIAKYYLRWEWLSQVLGTVEVSILFFRLDAIKINLSLYILVRIWDCRQPAPAAEAVLDERVYVMDATAQALVAGTVCDICWNISMRFF